MVLKYTKQRKQIIDVFRWKKQYRLPHTRTHKEKTTANINTQKRKEKFKLKPTKKNIELCWDF